MTTRKATRPKADATTTPKKGWRNKWLIPSDAPPWAMASNRSVRPGDIVWGYYIWPSKDVAETYAARHARDNLRLGGWQPEYLGAFPVEAS